MEETLTLQLKGQIASKLAKRAKSHGCTVEEEAEEILEEALKKGLPEKAKNGKELLEYWKEIGFLGMWEDRKDIGDSVEFARKLRKKASTRRRKE